MKKLYKLVIIYKYYSILALATTVLIGLGLVLEFIIGYFVSSSDLIAYCGFSLTFLSILVAIIQTIRSHDWNRRHLATTSLLEIKEKLTPHILLVHETFGYLGRDENDTIKVDQIHDTICKKDDQKQFVPNHATGNLELDDEKKDIYRAIWEILNLYEYIAAGVYQGVYDKKIVSELMVSNIIKAATVFSEYIEHVNKKMYPDRQGKIWVNVKTLGREFTAKHRSNTEAEARGS